MPDGVCFALHLRLIIFFEEEHPGALFFTRSSKVKLHLAQPQSGKLTGPLDDSPHDYVKLSFKEGFDSIFVVHLSDAISKRTWEFLPLIMPQSLAAQVLQLKLD